MDYEDEARAGELFRSGPRLALEWIDGSGSPRRRLFVEEGDLALALRALRDPLRAKARGAEGERLDVAALLDLGRALSAARRDRLFLLGLGLWQWRGDASGRAGHQTRWGPVPGVHARRGGGGAHRRMRTSAEIKRAQCVDEMEPAPRAKRSVGALPDAWDDVVVRRQKGWKSQGRGRKAWERAGREPWADRRALRGVEWGELGEE